MEKLPRENTNFTVDNITDPHSAIIELNKCAYFPNDPLYDGAFYMIHFADDIYHSEATIYLFKNENDKQKNKEANQIICELEVTEPMKICLNYIRKYYLKTNPNVSFDSIFITIQKDGRYIVNYEYENEEVQPQFPTKDVFTLEDYAQNLYNCLSHNAPDDCEWIWEILEKDDKNSFSGEFYYSMNKDRSSPVQIKLGDFIYMINVSSIMFDLFFKEKSANWKKVFLGFNDDRLHFGVMEKFNL